MKRKGKKTFRGTPQQHLTSAAKGIAATRKLANKAYEQIQLGRCESAFWKIVAMSEEYGAANHDLWWQKKMKKTRASQSKVNKVLEKFNKVCLRDY